MRQNKYPSPPVSAWCSPVNIFHQFAVELNPPASQMLLRNFFVWMRRYFVVVEAIPRKSCLLRESVLHKPLCRDPPPAAGPPETPVLSEIPGVIRDPRCYQRPPTASARLFSSPSYTSILSCSICQRDLWIFPGLFIPPHVQSLWCSSSAPPRTAGFLTIIVVLKVFFLPGVCGCTKWFQLGSGGSK